MMKSVHNWIAVVAVLAVTLLGAVAINRTSSERINTLRQTIVNVCQDNDAVRSQVNSNAATNRRLTATLRLALTVAARENGQTPRDSQTYQRLVALLGPVATEQALPILDCHRDVPRP